MTSAAPPSRRQFLRVALYTGSGVFMGCVGNVNDDGNPPGSPDGGAVGGPDGMPVGWPDAGPTFDAMPPCENPFDGGSLLQEITGFLGESGATLDTPFNVGWDGRLYTDLSFLSPGDAVVPNETHFIRTRYPDLLDTSAPWKIEVHGRVDADVDLSLADLEPYIADQGLITLECSGNHLSGAFGLLSCSRWAGAPLLDVLDDLVDVSSSATRVLVSGFDGHSVPSSGGHSTPGASWVFTFEDLRDAGAFLATEMNGVPLPPDHGKPVRLMIPGWYGCCNIKWVNEIELVNEDEPSTSQMREFASRTHQSGTPSLARNFQPATMDQTAMPIRVEKWQVDGSIVYKVIGIMWGGYEPTEALQVRFGSGEFQSVDVCPKMQDNRGWTLWQHMWIPTSTGDYSIRCRINDSSIRTRRLDSDFYRRRVRINEV